MSALFDEAYGEKRLVQKHLPAASTNGTTLTCLREEGFLGPHTHSSAPHGTILAVHLVWYVMEGEL